jgi:HEAT repeat protein
MYQVIEGGRGRSERPKASRDWAADLRDGRTYIRRGAAWLLSQDASEAPQAIGALAAALGDPDPAVRKWAGKALQQVGPLAFDTLVLQLGHESPLAREAAAQLIGRMGMVARRAGAALRHTLEIEHFASVRLALVQAIEAAGLVEGVDPCAS